MKTHDVQESLSEDFEPAQLAIGPDGGMATHPPEPERAPPPRLCERGPCEHYHRFAIQMDVERGRGAEVLPGGKVVGQAPPAPFHVQVHHYCYPTVGVEMKLGELPVLECNKWNPLEVPDDPSPYDGKGPRLRMLAAYQADLDAWRADQDKPATGTDDELAAWIAMLMRDGDELEVHHAGVTALFAAVDARSRLTLAFLKEGGTGSYRCWILRPKTDGSRMMRVATKTYEVT